MDSDSSCELSDQARAFSTILTAFIGSIVNGATNGYLVAFITGWISWLAVLRVLSGALVSLYQAFLSDDDSEEDVTVLGWIGWLYTAVYSPIVQILWLAENWSKASGPLKLVRALANSVAALSLTFDTKKRYATTLGSPAGVVFNIINGVSALGMGIICGALLIKGAIDIDLKWYIILIYCIFAVIWAAVSFKILPVQDGKPKGSGFIPGILMGAFAGIFLAAPAFALMQLAEQPTLTSEGFSTSESGQSSLNDYLSCESVPVWQKFVAIFP